ncbi:MAG: hypothetical protein GWN16_04670, partial [Calditrichae bacterium]|nr:hypothetical protein [Calditrichia bacterium]NIW78783.1 hypothetical protein [Calditrichia bacterium]
MTKLTGWKTDLETIRLYVSEAELSRLNARMPQSGLRYVKGRLMVNGKLIKAKFRYRGDFMYHWTYHKKSIRIKTSKGKLYQGIRAFNLQAPKFPEQLNNFLAFKLAREMGLLAPRTKLIRFFLNEKDMGIYIFIEQLKEMTLRHNGLMPGDIYRGEIMGPRDSFIDSGVGSLFETAEVWDKVSVNNHYPLEHKAPLSEFLRLIQHKQSPEAQKALGNLLDMDAWGKFSAFEALAQTDHFHSNHNYRIYFDPWRGKFIPIVWDPIGWNPHWKAKPGQKVASERIQHNLHAALFMNGDFQRARHQVLRDFFNSGKDVEFLALASKSIAAMEREIPNDPLLRPGNPQTVKANMKDFFKRIRQGFADIKETTGSGPPIQFHYKEGKLNFSVPGNHPLWRFRMIFDQRIRKSPKVQISYRTPAGIITVPVSDEIQLEGNQLTLTKGFLPNFKTTSSRLNKKIIKYEVIPGNYEIAFADFNKSLQLISLQVDRGRDWEEAVPGSPSPLRSFESLYAPVPEPTIKIPLVWSGNVQIKNVKKIQQPLIIKAGTRIHMGPGASLILEGRVLAQGTARNPIRFLPATSSQSPWGTVALTGRKANGSIFTHCLMEGGSGFKGKILEYSAMLSIHDVQKVTISDCVFRDNGIADDMVHAVYSDIQVIRTKFKG